MARETFFSTAGVDPTVEISKHVSKKGKLNDCNKREKKALKSICPHQIVTKNGKIKPTIEDAGSKNGVDMVRCRICGDIIKAGFYTDEEYAKAYNAMKPIMSQGKMLAAAIGVGKKVTQQIAESNLYLDNYGKTYKNMRNVAEKQERVRNKKKKKKSNNKLGGWNIR